MKLNINKKTAVTIASVMAIGVLLGALILSTDKKKAGDAHGNHAEQSAHADEDHHDEKK